MTPISIKEFGPWISEKPEYFISREKNYEGTCDYDNHEYLHKDFRWYENTLKKGIKKTPPEYNAFFKSEKNAKRFLMVYTALRKLRIVK